MRDPSHFFPLATFPLPLSSLSECLEQAQATQTGMLSEVAN